MHYEIVVIGTSWGGLAALGTLLGGLPSDFTIPVVIVQHRHRQSDHLLASLLQEKTTLRVSEVEDKVAIVGGQVHIAPADYHLLIERNAFALSIDEPVRHSRPSIDVTLESAAVAYGRGVVGVILTGANADGAAGLRAVVERGGLAIVEDPTTAASPAMPEAAIRAVPRAHVMPVPAIPAFLATLDFERHAALGADS